MVQPEDPINGILRELHEDLANCTTMSHVVLRLRSDTDHLTRLLTTMLAELASNIEEVLPALPREEDDDDA